MDKDNRSRTSDTENYMRILLEKVNQALETTPAEPIKQTKPQNQTLLLEKVNQAIQPQYTFPKINYTETTTLSTNDTTLSTTTVNSTSANILDLSIPSMEYMKKYNLINESMFEASRQEKADRNNGRLNRKYGRYQ
jgi:hypothetical protein